MLRIAARMLATLALVTIAVLGHSAGGALAAEPHLTASGQAQPDCNRFFC